MPEAQRIGRYILTRRIASGGMAELFLGKLVGPAGFEKEVVIKRILPQWSSDPDFVAMLIDEAKISVQLNHPNIVQVFELGREGDVYYIAMEFVNGADLRKLLQKAAARKKTVPAGAALWMAMQCLDGLAYAHGRMDAQGRPLKIVHRDISPQNILVSYDGQVKITDFGIAKAALRSQETVAGVLKGKFAYMSPEQANQEALDGRSDLFSLAVVLYELLTGERLFTRGSDLDTLDRVRRGSVEFSASAEAGIPEGLKVILKKALDRSPDRRFPDAATFRKALSEFAQRSGLPLHQEETNGLMKSLFTDEMSPKEKVSPEDTRVLTQSANVMLDATKTAHQEILAQSETVFLPDQPPAGFRAPRTSSPEMAFILRTLFGIVIAFILPALVWKALVKHWKDAAAKPLEAVAVREVIRASPKDTRPVPLEVPPPETQSSVPPIEMPSPKAAVMESPQPEAPLPAVASLAKEGRGFLSVQAIPWGAVMVDGAGKKETPVRRLALKEGVHVVTVTYEPDGSRLSQKVQVRNGREIVCIAKFRGGKSLKCAE